MAEDADHGGDHHREFEYERVTAPMQDFSMREVALGVTIALVGLAVVVGLPLLLA